MSEESLVVVICASFCLNHSLQSFFIQKWLINQLLIWVVPLYDYGFFALPSGSVAINFLTPKTMGQSWYQLQQKTQECTISDHRHLCWKMWRNLELLIHKGKFLSQPRKTPHYLNIEFIVFPFRLKSENFIVFRKYM